MSLFFFLLCLSNQRQHRRAPTETKATVGSTPNSGHRGRRRRQCSPLIMRKSLNNEKHEQPHQLMQTFRLFYIKKNYFFYFTYLFLQNTQVSLSILHIYSIKYSFVYNFLLFPHSLRTPFSHRPNTTKKN